MTFSPFFLTGAPKSGTTWLGKLLDAHPQINCRGEACVHHFGLELIKACRSYSTLLEQRRMAVTDSNDFPDLAWPDIMAMMRTFIDLRLRAIVDPAKTGLKFVGEKDPEHAMHLPTLQKLYPDARLIHIIRDGRGVFISAWHHNVRAKDSNLDRLGFDDFLDITAKEWAERVILARTTGTLWGDRYFEVRYEDLVADPTTWFARTLDFLGAESSAATVLACTEAASFENLSKGRKAGQEDASAFFRKGIPDDWRNQLTPAQIARFIKSSGTALPSFGYFD
jgi:Sulfotransferase family